MPVHPADAHTNSLIANGTLAMTDQHSNGIARDSMEVFIESNAIRAWHTDAFVWPFFTIAIATTIYTLFEWAAATNRRLDLDSFQISGELVGAGGMLFATLLLVSRDSRLDEWKHAIAPYCVDTEHVGICKQDLANVGEARRLLVTVAVGVTWLFVLAHVFVAHELGKGPAALKATLGLVIGNGLTACTVRARCLRDLYRARALIVAIHFAYLRQREATASSASSTLNSQLPK